MSTSTPAHPEQLAGPPPAYSIQDKYPSQFNTQYTPQSADYLQNYNQQHTAYSVHPQPGAVIGTQPLPLATVVQRHARPQNYMPLAICACVCFSPLIGIAAIVASAESSSAYEKGDIMKAKKYGNISAIFSVLGILVSLAIVAALYISVY